MTGGSWGYFGTGFSLLITAVVTIVLFVYTWMRSHGVSHRTHAHVDSRAGDEGEE